MSWNAARIFARREMLKFKAKVEPTGWRETGIRAVAGHCRNATPRPTPQPPTWGEWIAGITIIAGGAMLIAWAL